MRKGSSGDRVSVRSNTILDAAPLADDAFVKGYGIVLVGDDRWRDTEQPRPVHPDARTARGAVRSGDWLAALLALGCRSIRIDGNVVDEVARCSATRRTSPSGSRRTSASSGSTSSTTRSSPNPASSNADGKPTGLTESVGLLIGEMPGEQSLYTIGDKVYLISAVAIHQWWPASSDRASAIRGNRLDAVGDGPAAFVATNGSCTFAENHCTLVGEGAGSPGGGTPIVELGVQTLVLSGNQVVAPVNDAQVAVDANVAGNTITGDRAITALGNITAGQIQAQRRPLAATLGSAQHPHVLSAR